MYINNFNLSKEAEEYAKKLIEEGKLLKKYFGGVVSKSNVKLDDNFNEIEEE